MTNPKDATPPTAPVAELVPIDDLRPHPRNYRAHPEDQLAHIVASIREHGFYRNVVATRDGTVLAGHGVVAASRQLGLPSVPTIRLDVEPDDPRALRVLTGDNAIAALANDDDQVLAELLRELHDADGIEGLLGTGFDDRMLTSLEKIEGSGPDGFTEFDETIDTQAECPKCGYRWSGGTLGDLLL